MLGSTRPLVVAHSLGAVPALRAAADGLNVRRLVLVDPAGVMRLRVSMAVMRPTMPWLLWPNATTSARLLTMMMAAGHRPEPKLVTWMSLVGEHVRTSLAPSALPDHVLRDVRDLPIDVLSGEQDAFLPPARLQRALGRRLPKSSLHITPGAGHMLPHERPDTLLDHLGVLETR